MPNSLRIETHGRSIAEDRSSSDPHALDSGAREPCRLMPESVVRQERYGRLVIQHDNVSEIAGRDSTGLPAGESPEDRGIAADRNVHHRPGRQRRRISSLLTLEESNKSEVTADVLSEAVTTESEGAPSSSKAGQVGGADAVCRVGSGIVGDKHIVVTE